MTPVVVDLGCLSRNGADSLAALAEEYRPERIYGFDPSPELNETCVEHAGVPVTLRQSAAWTRDGTVAFVEQGSSSRIARGGAEVPCFDFSAWLKLLKQTRPNVVVKMDIEGAEVPVLQHMIREGTHELVDELLVEWHGSGEHLESYFPNVRRWWL